MSQLTEVSSAKCFEGVQKVFSHMSDETQCKMTFSIYIPPKASEKNKVPVIYWLSGKYYLPARIDLRPRLMTFH